jgi:hypothetical protein
VSLSSRAAVPVLALGWLLSSCGVMPPSLDEQKRLIHDGQFHTKMLTRQAFIEAWGKPRYEHVESTRFYVTLDGNYVPQFRVPMGEAPAGWINDVVSENGYFMAYPERGELLGFIEDRLVFREQMATEKVHAVAKKWQFESQFKTQLEAPTGRSTP